MKGTSIEGEKPDLTGPHDPGPVTPEVRPSIPAKCRVEEVMSPHIVVNFSSNTRSDIEKGL